MAALTLFYSYAHEDEAPRNQLEKHLAVLRREGMIAEWHDRKIMPGEAWAHEIDTHLETASIILLLVSPDFLNSDYCYETQMQHALERHRRGEARVIPIILRPCDWQHSPLKDLQCLPRDGKPATQWQDQDEVFNTITQSLRRVIEQQKALAGPPVPLSQLDRQIPTNDLTATSRASSTLPQTSANGSGSLLYEVTQQDPDVLVNPYEVSRPLRSPPPLPRRDNRNWLIIGTVVLVCVIVIGAVVALLFSRRTIIPPTQPTTTVTSALTTTAQANASATVNINETHPTSGDIYVCDPASITINKGDTINFTNNSDENQDFDQGDAQKAGVDFVVAINGSKSVTFNTSGTFTIKSEKGATITVKVN